METIDVNGLPEPVARELENLVATLRLQLEPNQPQEPQPKVQFPVKHGNVIGSLSREDIYGDAL